MIINKLTLYFIRVRTDYSRNIQPNSASGRLGKSCSLRFAAQDFRNRGDLYSEFEFHSWTDHRTGGHSLRPERQSPFKIHDDTPLSLEYERILQKTGSYIFSLKEDFFSPVFTALLRCSCSMTITATRLPIQYYNRMWFQIFATILYATGINNPFDFKQVIKSRVRDF